MTSNISKKVRGLQHTPPAPPAPASLYQIDNENYVQHTELLLRLRSFLGTAAGLQISAEEQSGNVALKRKGLLNHVFRRGSSTQSIHNLCRFNNKQFVLLSLLKTRFINGLSCGYSFRREHQVKGRNKTIFHRKTTPIVHIRYHFSKNQK